MKRPKLDDKDYKALVRERQLRNELATLEQRG